MGWTYIRSNKCLCLLNSTFLFLYESIKSPDIIIKGFVDADILDAKSKSKPSLEGIFDTMTLPMVKEDKNVLINKYDCYHEIQLNHGHLKVQDHLDGGLTSDTNSK